MRSFDKPSRHLLRVATPAALVCMVAAMMLLAPEGAVSYERWTDGCNTCHGGFLSGGYVSAVTGTSWPDSLHDTHRDGAYMDAECNLCHLGGDWDQKINESNGTAANTGYGCVGCHGSSPGGGIPNGSGLLLHHSNSGITTCVSCHPSIPIPGREAELPPYYGTVDSNVAEPCNSPVGLEDWNIDGLGLDTDGNLLHDSADLDCQPNVIFWDGFETGDGGYWGG